MERSGATIARDFFCEQEDFFSPEGEGEMLLYSYSLQAPPSPLAPAPPSRGTFFLRARRFLLSGRRGRVALIFCILCKPPSPPRPGATIAFSASRRIYSLLGRRGRAAPSICIFSVVSMRLPRRPQPAFPLPSLTLDRRGWFCWKGHIGKRGRGGGRGGRPWRSSRGRGGRGRAGQGCERGASSGGRPCRPVRRPSGAAVG